MYKVLIVVDMQKDFIDGSLGTDEAVAIVNKVAKRIADSKGELVLFTKDTHGADYLDTPEGKKLPVVHCVEGTEGWQINDRVMNAWRGNVDTIVLDELQENTFTKPVFGSVDLVLFLEQHANEISEIEILGLCTDICVVSNALMIKNTLPDIEIKVNAACCAGVTPQSHQEALNTMQMCQVTIINDVT
ncbi:MAG: cysteine hydrolase [Coriobacteriia bacterium]|nr:cysteine hydrolase [Coriobacteriia bacterium]